MGHRPSEDVALTNSLPKQICFLCKSQVLRYARFKRHGKNVQMLLETKVLGNEQVTKDVLKEINCRFPILNLNATKIFTLTYNEDFEKVTVNKTECNDVILTNDTEYWGCDDMDVKSEYDETIDVDTTEEVTINKTKHNDVVLTNDNNVDVKSQNDASINIDATEKNLDNDYFEEFLDSDNASEEDKLISGNSIEKNKKSKLKVTEEHGDVVATNDTLYLECKDTKNKSDESLSLDDANELICDDDFENFNNNDDDYSEEDKLKECFDNVDFEKNTNDDNELEEDELTSREHIKENKRSKPKISLILFSKKQQRTKIESDNDNNNESGINQKENDIDKLNNINKMVKIKTVPKKKLEKPKEKIGKSDTALEINELNVSKYNMTLKILTKEEQVEKMLAKKESEKYKNSRFKCKICYSVFMTETAFAMHNARHQPDTQRKSECKVCHVFVRKVKHRVHEREHAIEIVCTLCGLELLPSGIRIRTHHAFHQGNKFQCGQCDKSFSQHSTYVNHKRIKHGNTACGLCARVYFSDWGVTSHIRKSHRAEAPEQCNSCKHYFCNQEALQYHLGACSKSITPCAYCGLILPSATALGAHITSEHSKSKRAGCVCTDCQRPFSSEKNLKKHWIYMHQSGPNRKRRAQLAQKAKKTIPCQEGINSRKIKHKSCICEQCGAVLQSSSHLHIHMSVHTGEKAHRCEVCSRTFRLLNSLKQHQRVHTGEKPYKCSECSRTFRQGSHLRGHMRIHTGERPYHCEACSKTFALKANRDEHVRTVHEGQPPRRRRRVKNNRRKLNEYSDSD